MMQFLLETVLYLDQLQVQHWLVLSDSAVLSNTVIINVTTVPYIISVQTDSDNNVQFTNTNFTIRQLM